ncbi:MAG: phage integrase N-terminal SAM-like domain-containing protein [Desulfamplus sp.]|nr:phage integrase N-terminal SAM-like domain-containing protein [Desulfamplus sp.]
MHTERSYCKWIKRYIQFNKMKSRDGLNGEEGKIEQFLTYLAIDGRFRHQPRIRL